MERLVRTRTGCPSRLELLAVAVGVEAPVPKAERLASTGAPGGAAGGAL